MEGKLEFKEKLRGILALAQEQGEKITLEEVEQYFEEDHLSKEQMELVCDYLMSQKVLVKGYVKTSGMIKEAKEVPRTLTEEEQEYVTEYLRELECVEGDPLCDVRMKYYLPRVVDAALIIDRGGVFLGDVVQEGNISLMLALREVADKPDQEVQIMEQVRLGMQAYISSQTDAKLRDRNMVSRVASLDEAMKQLTEELGRKVSIDEVAEYMAVSEDEVMEIMKLAGEEI